MTLAEEAILRMLRTYENYDVWTSEKKNKHWHRKWKSIQYDGTLQSLFPDYENENIIFHKGKIKKGSAIKEINKLFLALVKNYIPKDIPVYEIGFGTGYFLTQLKNRNEIHGLELSNSSLSLAKKIGFPAEKFDIRNPKGKLKENSVVYTIAALEQAKDEKFITWLKNQKIQLAIHIEPEYDSYNREELFDYLSYWYCRKRGYPKKHKFPHVIQRYLVNTGAIFNRPTVTIWKPTQWKQK